MSFKQKCLNCLAVTLKHLETEVSLVKQSSQMKREMGFIFFKNKMGPISEGGPCDLILEGPIFGRKGDFHTHVGGPSDPSLKDSTVPFQKFMVLGCTFHPLSYSPRILIRVFVWKKPAILRVILLMLGRFFAERDFFQKMQYGFVAECLELDIPESNIPKDISILDFNLVTLWREEESAIIPVSQWMECE